MENFNKCGCNECVHNTSKWDWVNEKYVLIERICTKGNTKELVKWWEDNGHKKKDGQLDVMECHEYHESTKHLITMMKLIDEMKEILTNKK